NALFAGRSSFYFQASIRSSERGTEVFSLPGPRTVWEALGMSNGDLNWIANFIWGIADDVLRDVYVRGKYRDVILPMTVVRRLDGVLEPTKQKVLEMQERLDKAAITNQDVAIRQAAAQAF